MPSIGLPSEAVYSHRAKSGHRATLFGALSKNGKLFGDEKVEQRAASLQINADLSSHSVQRRRPFRAGSQKN
jgi:hypothetical protein